MSISNPLTPDNIIRSNRELNKIINSNTDHSEIGPVPVATEKEAIEMAFRNIAIETSFCADLRIKLLLNRTSV